jgi:flagellar hook-associated protein 2
VGALYGDTGLISMQSQLRQAMSSTFAVGNAATLDDFTDIGISSGKLGSSVEQAKSGLLQIDETKLADAIAKDPQAVQRLMGTADAPGFSQNVEKLIAGFSDTIKSRVTSITKEAKSIGDQMTAAEERLTAREKRLTAQFAAMEAALGAAQTQQSWLEGQIASLPGWGGSNS